MTVSEVLTFVDALKPNAFTQAQKMLWLSEVEGMVQTDVMLRASEQIISYTNSTDLTAKLLVEPPHDKLYRTYLCAMIDFYNGEYASYQNSMALFNTQMAEYTNWYARTYAPADTARTQTL